VHQRLFRRDEHRFADKNMRHPGSLEHVWIPKNQGMLSSHAVRDPLLGWRQA
jgi:hypothetical protein